jgi:hypothetical protein
MWFRMWSLLAGAALAAPIAVDRTWEVVAPPVGTEGVRGALRFVSEQLGGRTVELAGVPLTAERVAGWVASPGAEPLVRVVREDTGRPVDLGDLLYLFDDVLDADLADDALVSVPTGRARSYGLLVHPDDVWKGKARRYPRWEGLPIDVAPEADPLAPAADGDPPGPGWTLRYVNPTEREALVEALAGQRPQADFAARIGDLLGQLEDQGAEVWVTSTVRSRHRGYLMWGAFALSRATSEGAAWALVARLDGLNGEWGLDAPISWRHPDGWEATVEASRLMADAYDVVYATERGARYSSHYDGRAADFVVYGLPRSVTLTAPDGAVETFDLSDPAESRDLSLSVSLVRWIERHYGFSKLLGDHPHWSDAR